MWDLIHELTATVAMARMNALMPKPIMTVSDMLTRRSGRGRTISYARLSRGCAKAPSICPMPEAKNRQFLRPKGLHQCSSDSVRKHVGIACSGIALGRGDEFSINLLFLSFRFVIALSGLSIYREGTDRSGRLVFPVDGSGRPSGIRTALCLGADRSERKSSESRLFGRRLRSLRIENFCDPKLLVASHSQSHCCGLSRSHG